jgi:hypothetical protein
MFFKRKPQGKINLPQSRAVVSRLFRAEGTADNLPTDKHLFLVVQVGGLLWPKSEVQVNNSAWVSEIHEGGNPPNGQFTLSLYLVSRKAYENIAAWEERGQTTGHYSGLRSIGAGIKLHSIKLRLES